MKFTALILLVALGLPTRAEDSLPLYQCFSKVRVQGEVENANAAFDRINKIINVGSRIHAPTTYKNRVVVEAIVSVNDLDRDDAKSKVSVDSIKTYLALTNLKLDGAEVVFLGCAELTLKR